MEEDEEVVDIEEVEVRLGEAENVFEEEVINVEHRL